MVRFGGELAGGAVSGALPGIWRVVGAVRVGVLEFIEDICDVSGHKDVAGLVFVVQLQGEDKVELNAPA